MSTERDAGLQALQQGDNNGAIQLLETACQQSPEDYDALLYLGAAYGQAGRQMDAITTITKAVQLRPGNAQARYNLGIAMEQGGFRDQAIQVMQQALTLQPEYPRAREALLRLQGPVGAPSAGARPVEPAPPPGHGTTQSLAGHPLYGPPAAQPAQPTQPTQSLPSSPPGGQPPVYGASPPSGYTAEQAGASSGLPQMGFGQVAEPPREASSMSPQAPAPGGYGQAGNTTAQFGSPYAPQEAPMAGYGQPPPSPYGVPTNRQQTYAPGPYGAERPVFREIVPDSFDLVQAARDWLQVIISPATFFRNQVGRDGMKAPFALFLLYCIPYIISTLLPTPVPPRPPNVPENVYSFFAGSGKYFLLPVTLAVMGVLPLMFAWLSHLIGQAFGNNSPFAASYRATIYSLAPMPLMVLIYAIAYTAVGLPLQSLGPLYVLVECIWVAILFCLAIYRVQQISVGAAIGVFVLSLLAFLLLFFGICFAIGIVVGIIIAVVASNSH